MRIQIWQMDVMLEKLFGHPRSVEAFKQIIDKCFKSSDATSPCSQRSRTTPLYQQLPVNYGDYSLSIEKPDSLSAQMNTCRDQKWWEPQALLSDTETLYDDDGVDCQNMIEPPKRSLSIREIRQRMNSAQIIANDLDGRVEFEPGLKFLDGIRGGWKDLEMFID
jgi:hypothetical protein